MDALLPHPGQNQTARRYVTGMYGVSAFGAKVACRGAAGYALMTCTSQLTAKCYVFA
jgi:hypothetical protein